MNKKLCVARRITGHDGRLEYYLTENRFEDIKNGISTMVFGVEIRKITIDEKGVELIQRNVADELSVERQRVLDFLYVLSDMEVMPVSLKDIAEDFVQDDFFIESSMSEKSA